MGLRGNRSGPESVQPESEHGPSIFDARHRWVMSASWELPIFKNSSGVAKAVLAGWQLNGIANFSSGTPFTVYDSVDFLAVWQRA